MRPTTRLYREASLSINTALVHLPPYTETAPELMAERNREKEIAKRRLANL